MALVKLNTDPSPRDLRWFGLLFAFFFGLLGLVAWKRWGSWNAATVVWTVGAVVPVVYYVVPPLKRPIYLGWTYLVYPIGLVISFVVLGIVYFGVVTPIGLLLRLLGQDPLQRRFDPSRKTYWVDHRTGDDPARYLRQF